ncbi:MAG: MltA domain-containing protein [Smithellaceae bacterium]|jgi:membrane-bound lytic murein transglycosylase A
MKHWRNTIRLTLIVVCLVGCVRALPKIPPRLPEKPLELLSLVAASNIDFTDDLDLASLELAIERSVQYYETTGRDKVYRIADRSVDSRQLIKTLTAFRALMHEAADNADLSKKITEVFDVYRVAGPDEDGRTLFTGYYEPLLEGSLTESEKYKYPLYRVPDDLIVKRLTPNENKIGRIQGSKFVPYYSRREIDVYGVLRGKNLELIWVADPVDLFFLHVQGSGKIKLEDETLLTVSFAQTNGRPFRSVTRFMLDQGKIKSSESSYRSVKAILKEREEQERYEILSYNESYIFFRFVDKEPRGSLGVPVTPGRSLATDPDYFPEGALAFIRLRKPVFDSAGNVKERVNFSRFVLSQDKGSAIKGPGRVDLFCGFGAKAEATAGTLKEKGELYLLLKK